jgi:AcrR family transcriptional regulator
MKTPRIDVGSIRREQIVHAAIAVIAEQGIQNLSLSEIETKAGMSRGQLTYYFRTKEDILLAVFDRLIEMMHERAQANGVGGEGCGFPGQGWEHLTHFLTTFLLNPPDMPEFNSLQYTFLSQIGHRDDFREKLASLYGEWRGYLAQDVADDLERRPGKKASPRTVATLVQAILHGLAIQRAADPDVYDRQEMLELCMDLLGSYLRRAPAPSAPVNGRSVTNGRATDLSHEGKK